MPDVFATLPTRPLRPRMPSPGDGVWAMVGLLVLLGLAGGMPVWAGPALVTDWLVRPAAVTILGGAVSDSSCDNKFLLMTCEMTLTAPVGRAEVSRQARYLFASTATDDLTATVVADPAHPQWLSTDLGLDNFWNRLVTLVAAMLATLALAVFGVRGAIRNRRRRRAWESTPVVPVPLWLTGMQKVRNGRVWIVRNEAGRTTRWTVPRRAKPFRLGPSDPTGERVLGVEARGGGGFMPLDDRLAWIDLSPAERRAVLASVPKPPPRR